MRRQIIWMAFFTVMVLYARGAGVCVADGKAVAVEDKPLMVFFEKGKSAVSDADKARIGEIMADLSLAPGDKIMVVGHTDSSGDAQGNLKLSQKRAGAVRRQIISVIGDSAGKDILVVAKGAENPLADNGSPVGRARNRRVEIYYAQVVSGRLVINNRRITPDMVTVETLVQNARSLLRRRQLREALRVLQAAYAQGGERFSSWQALYGIAGYYAGMPSEKVGNHLRLALRMDPFNEEARDYLGRLEVRERVAAGVVTPAMGRSPEDPIVIHSDAQAHEYLRLFGVQALSHAPLAQDGIEAWRCRDADGKEVVYHFDRSMIDEDIYNLPPPTVHIPGHSLAPSLFPSFFSGLWDAEATSASAAAPAEAATMASDRIRESNIY